MSPDEVSIRRFIAGILGLLGFTVLIDVAVVAILQPDAVIDGFRQVLFVIVGGLLVISGAVTFAWPRRGSVETADVAPAPAPTPVDPSTGHTGANPGTSDPTSG